jgi:hypothetical protein
MGTLGMTASPDNIVLEQLRKNLATVENTSANVHDLKLCMSSQIKRLRARSRNFVAH